MDKLIVNDNGQNLNHDKQDLGRVDGWSRSFRVERVIIASYPPVDSDQSAIRGTNAGKNRPYERVSLE